MSTPSKGDILVVDDDADIREILQLLLTDDGYTVRLACNGTQALAQLDPPPDLIVLDVMMPGDDGFTVCRKIRERSHAPVLYVTALSQEVDKVRGLRTGGDDYLTKPFSPAELSARVEALLRRYREYRGAPGTRPRPLIRGNVQIDLDAGRVTRAGQPVTLTDLERRLLLQLAGRAGEAVDTRTLYECVWAEPYMESSAATVMVHIRNLRKKLEDDPANPTVIHTVWGKGYRIDA